MYLLQMMSTRERRALVMLLFIFALHVLHENQVDLKENPRKENQSEFQDFYLHGELSQLVALPSKNPLVVLSIKSLIRMEEKIFF